VIGIALEGVLLHLVGMAACRPGGGGAAVLSELAAYRRGDSRA
jgi:hypothetical protein